MHNVVAHGWEVQPRLKLAWQQSKTVNIKAHFRNEQSCIDEFEVVFVWQNRANGKRKRGLWLLLAPYIKHHPGSNSINIQIKWCVIKGIVHPKKYSTSSSSKPVWISLFCRTQRKTFWRKFVIRLFWGTIDLHSRKKKYYGSQWCPRTALLPTFFRIYSFVFCRTKTFIQVWNYWVSKWWHNFHFWVNYRIKTPSALMLMLLFTKS